MRGLELSKLFVVLLLTYIFGVINENVCKVAKPEILKLKFMKQMIYHLERHEILNKMMHFFVISACISRVRGENFHKMSNMREMIYMYHHVGHEILIKTLCVTIFTY